ncbi:MAG: Rrf2 family transcriptional regulator [Bacteroidales bacterium]|jgi:Rrf2 family protein
MLSSTSRYAIRALIYLVINYRENTKIGIKTIAKDLGIPSPFLGKILQTLTKKKILSSTKGPNGGFFASEKTRDTSLTEIIQIIDGDDLFENCLISNEPCNNAGNNKKCSLHNHYESIRKEIVKMFNEHTIGKLAEEYKNSDIKIRL